MSYHEVRQALAAVEVTGVTTYDHYVGTPASTPALIVGLPTVIATESHGLERLEWPLELVVGGGDKAKAEQRILELAKTVRDAYRGLVALPWRSCRWAFTSEFQTIALGSHQGLTCTVTLELLVND